MVKFYKDLMEFVNNNLTKKYHPIPGKKWKWNWDYLSKNPSITFQNVLDNPDKPWDWRELSRNKSITFQNVIDNPDKKWNWGGLSLNTSITTPHIQNQAAYVIQKACYNWLWNTTTKDGMVGINCRIGLKKCGLTF
jgi:hypothetical protein